MSAAVHRSHGGDAGGDPPPNPNRIPTSCERSMPKKRGISRSANLEAAFKANGGRPLPIGFDKTEDTYKAVGQNSNMFIRYIGNLVGIHIPPYYSSWDDVPNEYKMGILPRIEQYFALDRQLPEWPMILAGIERECQDRYRERKARYKKHFLSVGGYADMEIAKKNPPSTITDETWWRKTVDFFADPENMTRAEKNAQNRSNVKYPSLHGSTSYVASRYKKRNRETQELPSPIDHWQQMHHRPNGGWVSEAARLDHERMLAEYTRQTQTAQSTLDGEASINETQIISKVLGERRGHNTGRGRRLKDYGRDEDEPQCSHSPLQNPQSIDVDAMIASMAARQPQQPSNDEHEDDHDDEGTGSQDD
ncbi:hypothetical protein OSB04_022761 [Centaurea solstitialis]|uniref:Transposase, Ptta/En/Spm, plant n=1 Tax=Centaurea solstitialis TaxID=347529 RepID=A0AA38SJI2_9ASTR|nr:hypothetical protein OSB04_022761 [Centaurea solstitialis]